MRRAITVFSISWALAAACLAFSVGPLEAGDTLKVDFDNGGDSTGIVEHARRQGRMRRAPVPLPMSEIKQPEDLERLGLLMGFAREHKFVPPQAESPKMGRLPLPSGVACDQMPVSKDDPGGPTPSLCIAGKDRSRHEVAPSNTNFVPVTGPYEPLPRDNQDYKESVELKPQLGPVGDVIKSASPDMLSKFAGPFPPPPIRGPLHVRWNEFDTMRTNFIADARRLDADDEAQSQFAYRLNKWLDNIRARKPVLDYQLSEYNRLCMGRQLPDDEFRQCKDFVTRYNNCVRAHNASLAERDRLAGVWQDNKRCLQSRGDAFRAQIVNWANVKIKPWLSDAKAAIAAACNRLRALELLPVNPKVATGGKALIFRAWAYFEGEAKQCPVSYLWSADPAIGSLAVSPGSQLVATLTSGPSEAVGKVIVEGVDTTGEKRRAESLVSVVDLVQVCEVERVDCRPSGELIINECNYYCCGDKFAEIHPAATCNIMNCPTRFCTP